MRTYTAQTLFLSILVVAAAAQSLASEPAKGGPLFPDKKLEAAVRKQVFEKRHNDAPLVEADVVDISTVQGIGQGISDLTGLEKCRGLASLDLAKNEIRDLSPLRKLTRLQYLSLAENRIQDLEPLAAVQALQYLELSRNEIRDIGPLQNLTNLSALYLSHNQLFEITPILRLPRLVSLYLDSNYIRSLEGINALRTLSTLSARTNAISGLAPIRGLERLSLLFLQENKLRDLNPLVEMIQANREQRFAPFLNVYLEANPIPADIREAQISALKKAGVRVHE